MVLLPAACNTAKSDHERGNRYDYHDKGNQIGLFVGVEIHFRMSHHSIDLEFFIVKSRFGSINRFQCVGESDRMSTHSNDQISS